METDEAPAVIELDGVAKTIKDQSILQDIHLKVPAGRIYGISGHNGSGKSMLLSVICGLVYPTRGRVHVFGEAIGETVEFPKDTGILIETPGFLSHHSGIKNLELLAMIRNEITTEEIATTLRQVGLDPDDRRPVRSYSTGMRQRLGLAQALMEKPRLLLLDEPTSGIDREGIQEIHQLLKTLNAQGVTILLTSHSGEELQALCSRTFQMEKGTLTHPDGVVHNDLAGTRQS